jgi:hypothetical protein
MASGAAPPACAAQRHRRAGRVLGLHSITARFQPSITLPLPPLAQHDQLGARPGRVLRGAEEPISSAAGFDTECLRIVRYALGRLILERADGDEVRGTHVGSGAGGRADHNRVGRPCYGCATVIAAILQLYWSLVVVHGRSFEPHLIAPANF